MDELYKMIEKLIADAGYPEAIDGKEFYDDVSDEVDEKEPGTYMVLIKKSDTLSYQCCLDVLEDQFDLHYVDIYLNEQKYHVDFDV